MLNIFLKTQLTKKAYNCIKIPQVVQFQVCSIHDSQYMYSVELQWNVNFLHKKNSTGFPSNSNCNLCESIIGKLGFKLIQIINSGGKRNQERERSNLFIAITVWLNNSCINITLFNLPLVHTWFQSS